MLNNETIVALSSAAGTGAIAIIRLSGERAFEITEKIFIGKNLAEQNSHTLHFGKIVEENKVIDEVVVGVFKAPNSYTSENVVEISCHGSVFIQQKIIALLLKNGARAAKAGEFTLRAFIHGKMDLSQAEAVADLIASDSESNHELAMNQMRGGFSLEIKNLRDQLINFASMIELELDFAEEDVEFASRKKLIELIEKILRVVKNLIQSFELGNVLKNGVNTVIAGRPNAGKSTLMNALLNEERSIVSEIPGTTRDSVEEILNVEGIQFRLIDTAGIREATDFIEKMGVERTMEKIKQSAIVIYLFDATMMNEEDLVEDISNLNLVNTPLLLVANKSDKEDLKTLHQKFSSRNDLIFISAKNKIRLIELKTEMVKQVLDKNISSFSSIVTNARHYDALKKTEQVLEQTFSGIENKISGELLAQNIRTALNELGTITGEITNDDLLINIFSKFCIGK